MTTDGGVEQPLRLRLLGMARSNTTRFLVAVDAVSLALDREVLEY